MSKVKSKNTSYVKNKNNPLFIFVSSLAVIISFIYSYKLKWLGDDIFIGFRYVQNFLNGNGMVYNAGERVEGYTDFLWIILISLFSWLKLSPLITVQFLGILSSLGTLIIFSIITHKLNNQKNHFIVPFIGLSLALNYDYNVWATSGLETAFFGFLLSAAFYSYFFSTYKEVKKIFFLGLFLCLAMLTRPDAILILALSNILLLVQQIMRRVKTTNIISKIFYLNFACVLIYIPYFIWRFQYYGFLFPNTYYDKLGYESMFSKGFYYIWLYFEIHFVSFLLIILPPIALIPFLRKKFVHQPYVNENNNLNPAYITSLLFVFVYLLGFVAKVGGDFMFARFIIPTAPFICFIIYFSLLKIISGKNLNKILIVLLCLSFIETKLRFNFFKGHDENGNKIIAVSGDVADERDVHVNFAPIEIETRIGKQVHVAFDGIDAKLLIAGGQACFGYYSNFSYCQEMHGLTDTLIAHSTVTSRGRIGHEKQGKLEYFQKKGIDFLFNRDLPSNDTYQHASLILPPFDIDLGIITYKTDLMNKVKERFGSNIQFTDFPTYLDNYIIKKLPIISHNDLKKDFDKFSLYYFQHNEDKIRENQFLNVLDNYIEK